MGLDRLIEAIDQKQNPTVAGLDPRLDYLPDFLKQRAYTEYGQTLEGAAEAVWEYNRCLIDALCDVVPAVKPQAAYYELYGWAGMRTLAKTIRYAKDKGLFVITDGKRNDIGTTMEAYAAAHLGETDVGGERFAAFDGDALTVNGYLGSDGILPLLDICKQRDRGIFVLCKTSNPGSGELQDKRIDGTPVYAAMGDRCERWGEDTRGAFGYSAVGAVVGATYPEQLRELRERLPHTVFLVPGYGAQGGGAKDVAGAFDQNGRGAVVNSSRAILCAWKKEECDPADFAGAARREALRMKADLTAVL
ncbi:MAG: orotidine-5'-phosphate decarboxylase [Clostridia bacterium]|nr:orotidine-5'-phosphate decarboxylase [Clostridia bacterium]